MCEQCLAATESFGEVVPGYSLHRATRDGGTMRAGDWGLVHMNDPSLTWRAPLEIDPFFAATDDDFTAAPRDTDRAFWASVNTFEAELDDRMPAPLGLMESWRIVQACISAGYDPDVHGWRVTAWLMHRMATHFAACGGHPIPDEE
jgi:hypothetical protein